MTSGSSSWDKVNEARTVAGSGIPFLDGRICTMKGRVPGHRGEPATMSPQLLTNPPISVIVVGWVRMNSGPTNWELLIVVPADPNTLNCVAGVAAPNASTSESVDVPTTPAVRPGPRSAVSLGAVASWQAAAIRAVRPSITDVLIVPSVRFELPCLSVFEAVPQWHPGVKQMSSVAV